MEPGDLLQLSFDGLQYRHTPVVVSVKYPVTPENILVAAHSDDADQRPLSTYPYQRDVYKRQAYAMTGWRIGYTAAPEHITKVMSTYLGHSTAAPSTISQAAAAEAFRGSQDSVHMMHEAFEARRNYMVERMNAIPHIKMCIRDSIKAAQLCATARAFAHKHAIKNFFDCLLYTSRCV